MSYKNTHVVRNALGRLLRASRALAGAPDPRDPKRPALAQRSAPAEVPEPSPRPLAAPRGAAPRLEAPEGAERGPDALTCAFCGQLTSEDGGRYKTHFARVEDPRPCRFSWRLSAYPFSRG